MRKHMAGAVAWAHVEWKQASQDERCQQLVDETGRLCWSWWWLNWLYHCELWLRELVHEKWGNWGKRSCWRRAECCLQAWIGVVGDVVLVSVMNQSCQRQGGEFGAWRLKRQKRQVFIVFLLHGVIMAFEWWDVWMRIEIALLERWTDSNIKL